MSTRRSFFRDIGACASVLMLGVTGRIASTVYGRDGEGDPGGVFVSMNFTMGSPHRVTQDDDALAWFFDDHPLEDVRDVAMAIEDPYHPIEQGHGAFQGLLSGAATGNQFRVPGGISIDRQIASDLAGDGPNRSLHLGYPYGHEGRRANSASDGPGQKYPVWWNPQEAIAQYFGDFDPSLTPEQIAEQARILAEKRLSVLDVVREDIGSISGRMAPTERAAMDQYLTSIRELEIEAESIIEDGAPASACEVPEVPAGEFTPDEVTVQPELMEFYMDLGGLALSCGVVRVANINGPGVGDFPGSSRYPFLADSVEGIDPGAVGYHAPTTHSVQLDEHKNYIREVHRWRASLVRRLWAYLEQTSLGDGSLADASVLMWLNAMGRHAASGNHHNKLGRHPVITLGTAGNRLRTGRVVRLDEGTRCTTDVYLTLARAMGSTIESFGPEEHSGGVIDEMLR